MHPRLVEQKSTNVRPPYCPPLFLPPLSHWGTSNVEGLQCPDEICSSCLYSLCFSALPLPLMAEQKTSPKPGEVVTLDRQPCTVETPGISSLTETCFFPNNDTQVTEMTEIQTEAEVEEQNLL